MGRLLPVQFRAERLGMLTFERANRSDSNANIVVVPLTLVARRKLPLVYVAPQ